MNCGLFLLIKENTFGTVLTPNSKIAEREKIERQKRPNEIPKTNVIAS
jgi:hypothetical protein